MEDCIFEISWSSILMSQLGDLPMTSSCCSFWQILKFKMVRIFQIEVNLHDVWVFKIIWREDLQLKFIWNRPSIHVVGILVVILVADEISNDIWLSDVNQEAVANDNWTLQLCEGAISFTEISDFVLTVHRLKLDVELATLMVVAASHHRVNWRLQIFTGVSWNVRVVHWNDEVIHESLGHLLPVVILDVATSRTCSIFRVVLFIFFIVFGAIFNAEVCVSIVFLSTWTTLELWLSIKPILIRNNAHWVNKQCEVLL